MSKNKYRIFSDIFGDAPAKYECTKPKCNWQGTQEEKRREKISSYETELVCPDCGNNEFYGLI